MELKIGKMYFAWMPRMYGIKSFEDDPTYDANGLDRILLLLADVSAWVGGEGLNLPGPVAGYVRKIPNTDYYMPCGEFTDGARPAWIWNAVPK
jgi:hypothetical protein